MNKSLHRQYQDWVNAGNDSSVTYPSWLMVQLRGLSDAINPCMSIGQADGSTVKMTGNPDPRLAEELQTVQSELERIEREPG
jgi:hypothetical protein